MELLTHIHIADIHFGSIDPKKEFDILYDQFLVPVSTINFDILAIDGDLFDRKLSANSEAVRYAIEFVNRCYQLCLTRNAVLIMISGTESHEAGQLSLFYDMQRMDPKHVCIIEDIQFVWIKGYKILCIPEKYNMPPYYYESKLSEIYDMCFMHGTLVGGVYGANQEKLYSSREPVFSIDSFSSCKGPIISGHVHKAMCLNSYMYYVSNPIRYKFGEEEEKGYGICISSDNGHYYSFEPITSFRYITIDFNTFNTNDPNTIVSMITQMQADGIDYLRVDMSNTDPKFIEPIMPLLEKHYAQNPSVSFKKPNINSKDIQINATSEVMDKYSELDFILDPKLTEMDKFVLYINHQKGFEFINVDRLKNILSGE